MSVHPGIALHALHNLCGLLTAYNSRKAIATVCFKAILLYEVIRKQFTGDGQTEPLTLYSPPDLRRTQ